ncbi:MAG TPA: hypothetical protein VIJ93_03555, partial [bacterium]
MFPQVPRSCKCLGLQIHPKVYREVLHYPLNAVVFPGVRQMRILNKNFIKGLLFGSFFLMVFQPMGHLWAFSTNQAANVVVGQANMTSSSTGTTANTLKSPYGVWVAGKIFVADSNNNRVLIYNTIPVANNASANVVVGQPNMTTGTANTGGIGPNALDLPKGVYSDG